MIQNDKVETFWQAYQNTLTAKEEASTKTYQAWFFCDNEKSAHEVGRLAQSGVKTATCSLVWGYEAENEEPPKAGTISIVTDWQGEPLCIIETLDVQIKAFNEVEAGFAYDEGEGDRSLAFWRRVHWEYFSRECAEIGREPSETMPLFCERFRVVYRPER